MLSNDQSSASTRHTFDKPRLIVSPERVVVRGASLRVEPIVDDGPIPQMAYDEIQGKLRRLHREVLAAFVTGRKC